MPEIFDRVLPLNLIANTAIFYVAARLYLLPALSSVRPQQVCQSCRAAMRGRIVGFAK